MAQHLILVPSLACPASCAYCFGPHAGGKTMGRDALEAVVRWQAAAGGGVAGEAPAGEVAAERDPGDGNGAVNGKLEITFHGGEPLVAGAVWYRMALPLLRDGLAPRKVRFAIQTNLWLLTDELCDLFREHGVSVGTSLDGPEAINDAQRGAGYFDRRRGRGLPVHHRPGSLYDRQ